MTDSEAMREAIRVARIGMDTGQTPFGACIIKDGALIVSEHNVVWATTDITAHAEVNAIRAACRTLQTVDLSGCVIYSTCEPCPMCFSAIHWARIQRIVFAAAIEDAARAGFHELTIANTEMKRLGGSDVEIISGVLQGEARELFQAWRAHPEHRPY